MELRLALPSDRDAIWALYRACVREARFTCWNDLYPTLEDIDIDLAQKWLYLFVDSGAPVGSVSLLPTDDVEEQNLPFAYPGKSCVLARLCLSPERQGRGESATLLRLAERQIATLGYQTVHLLCDAANPVAEKCYLRAGYRYVADVALYGKRSHAFEKALLPAQDKA